MEQRRSNQVEGRKEGEKEKILFLKKFTGS